MKKICIYHGECADGFGAAWVVWKFAAKEVWDIEFHAGHHGEAPPDIKGKDVIVVDFSYKRPVLNKIIEDCNSLLVLDHHQSAENDLAGLDCPEEGVEIYFDMKRSGAMMAWDHFFPVSDQYRPSSFPLTNH